ncbi:AAA family ATPase [candidate division KSB3 bacterium]|nr:AAA family ATPase [candidate division KSB3 bacterium]
MMQQLKPSAGLSFKKLDLHIHTPKSRACFSGECSPNDLVEMAISKGLAGIAITDHNTAEWVDEVIDAAKGKPLVVFPGVEITCTAGKKGIHVVALFDVTKRAADVIAVLNKLDIDPGDYGKKTTLTDKTPQEVIDVVHSREGIAVPAHVNSSNGVLHDMYGEQRTRVIQHPRLLAVEATDFRDEDKMQKHKRVVDLLDGTDPTYQRKLAVYQASDNLCTDGSGQHCLEGVGSRCAYFKLEKINLESLRQCFIDPDVRIRQDFELRSHTYPHIEKVSITSGFLDGQSFEFHPGLTSILGAKGAGKSLLIEFIRFALNQEPEHPSIADDHAAKLRERLEEYGTVEITFIDETGKKFTVSRTYRELDDSPYDETIPYDPAQVFPVLFLSQNEIIKIAEDEQSQLQFIDQFFDFRTRRSEIRSLERRLERLDKRMAEGLRAYSELDELNEKTGTLRVEIEKLDKALQHPIFEEFKQLELKEKALSKQISHLSSVIASIEEARQQIRDRLTPDIPEALARDPAVLRNKDLIVEAHEMLEDQFSRLISELRGQLAKAEREYAQWGSTYAAGKKRYDDYVQAMGSDHRGLAVNRERAVRQMGELERLQAVARKKKDRLPDINKEREGLLDSLESEYEEYTSERQDKCVKFQADSHGRLELRILGASNVEEFRSKLLALKTGSYLREDEIDEICLNIRPRDFVLSLLRYHATKRTSHLEERAEEAGISLDRMRTLADFLLNAIPYEELLALQYKVHPQDRPEILYDIGGGDYQPLSKVSVGQKCTAMLIIALSDGIMPIVIDQPEDSLDIRSIWNDMCQKLRTGKEKRQFIFTTHNSSLAVASDSDCYLILEGSALQGEVAHRGSMDIQPVGGEVLKYLEGGPTTYDLKFAKYGREQDVSSN